MSEEKSNKKIVTEKKVIKKVPEPIASDEKNLRQIVTEQADFLRKMKGEMSELREDNELLKSIADKKRLARYNAQHQDKLPTHINIREYDGKIVVGWKTLKNVCEQNPRTGVWMEDQTVQLIFADGEQSNEIPYRSWVLGFKKIKCIRLSVIKDEQTDSLAFKLKRLDNGEIYTIADTFIN